MYWILLTNDFSFMNLAANKIPYSFLGRTRKCWCYAISVGEVKNRNVKMRCQRREFRVTNATQNFWNHFTTASQNNQIRIASVWHLCISKIHLLFPSTSSSPQLVHTPQTEHFFSIIFFSFLANTDLVSLRQNKRKCFDFLRRVRSFYLFWMRKSLTQANMESTIEEKYKKLATEYSQVCFRSLNSWTTQTNCI